MIDFSRKALDTIHHEGMWTSVSKFNVNKDEVRGSGSNAEAQGRSRRIAAV